MFSHRNTRRGILCAAALGGFVAGGPAFSQVDAPLAQLGRQVRALNRQSPQVDYEDPAAEAAYNATAEAVISAVAAQRARSLGGLRVKAEALAWCHGGKITLGPNPSLAERLVASIAADLLEPPGGWE